MKAAARILTTPSLSEQMRHHLLAELTSGRLRPGDRINEAEMSRSLGISRNPIREAISGLAQRGFLVAAPRRGHFLRRFTAADIDDVFSFRICVECFALQAAMPRMTIADRRGFARLLKKMVTAAKAGRVAELHQTDVQFHRRICEMSGNRHALRAHEGIDTELQMLMAAEDLDLESPMDTAMIHEPITLAIVAGDLPRASSELEAHLRQTWANVAARHVALDATVEAPRPSSRSRPKRSETVDRGDLAP